MQYVSNEFVGQFSNNRHGSMEHSKRYVCYNEQYFCHKCYQRVNEWQYDRIKVDDQQQPVRGLHRRCNDQCSYTCEYGECWQ